MRRSTHPKAWGVADMRLMIECWLDRWDPGSMAALFDRSKGSIYALKRRLNLPPRQRSEIRRPGRENYVRRQRQRLRRALCGTAAPQTPSQAPKSPTRVWEAERASLSAADGRAAMAIERPRSSPLAALLAGSLCETPLLAPVPLAPPSEDAVTVGLAPQPDGTVLRIERKTGRNETLWTLALDLNLAFRHFARQHYKAIARDLGLSVAALRTRVTRLELPSFPRAEQVQHFDPGVVAASIRQSGYVLRRCRGSVREFYFWAPRNGPRISRDAKKSTRFRNAASGLDDGCSLTL